MFIPFALVSTHTVMCFLSNWDYFIAVEGEELSEEVVALGYPHQHPHKLVSLRHELVDAFVE